MYNKRVWLNKDDSPSTGNVVAFDGEVTWRDEKIRDVFLSVSDCNVSARLHKSDDDTIEDFIDKMELLKTEIGLFIDYLKQQKEAK
ncbi:MAG: hypothetical protein LBJ39_00920 [Tannerellaceae bacterium]|jgi:hypothetical protein|nr:hypothetical protein [Tannerellaceae bacterium]